MDLSLKIVNKAIFAFLFSFLLFTDAFGLGNYHLLKKGNLAREEGRINDAVFHYNRYISSHPTVIGINSSEYHNSKQYYIRNLLIAFTNLINLHKKLKDTETIEKCINQLKSYDLADTLGAKNRYALAMIFHKNGFTNDSVPLFEQIVFEQKNNYSPFNNKVALRAVSKLLKSYQAQGKNAQLIEMIGMLRTGYPIFDFDLKDHYRLASIYLDYGFTHYGMLSLEKIIELQKEISDLSEINTIVKTYTTLLKSYAKNQEHERLENLYTLISTKYPPSILSANNQYQIAIAYLNCGKKNTAIELLENISLNFPQAVAGRKSLFLLGRLSLANEDWEASIGYFSEYISRYPDPPFFALKAYSRLIDAYWSSNYHKDLVQNEIQILADIVNNVSDFETQLNLARDLKWKGMDHLAQATFDLGLFSAQAYIADRPNSYDALRAHWIIEKYAYFLERFPLVEQSAAQIFDMIKTFENLSPDEKKKIDYIENQTLLWLAKMNIDLNQFNPAKNYLERFLVKFSNHQEADYVRYEYAKILENNNEIQQALVYYNIIETEMWKKKAEERIARIMAHEE